MADLLFEIADGVATLTMNRPEARNALSLEMRQAMHDFLDTHERDDTVRCVILRGAGDHFLAGGDVKSFVDLTAEMTPDELRAHFLRRIHDLHGLIGSIRRFPKPIIASVSGAAAGAGVSIAAACDLVIAAENSFFTLAYCHIGISPDGSATYSLPRAIGVKKAMEMTLLGDRYDAATMERMGLVNRVVPTEKLGEETEAMAKRLAKGPALAYAQSKKLIYASLESQFERQLQMEAECFAECAASQDFREGVVAFAEKRQPSFTGH